jgi:hypothetical protein
LYTFAGFIFKNKENFEREKMRKNSVKERERERRGREKERVLISL